MFTPSVFHGPLGRSIGTLRYFTYDNPVIAHSFLLAMGSAVVVSLVSLVGILTLPLGEDRLKQWTFILISLAAGALFGDVAFHLLPEIFAEGISRLDSSLWVLGGIFTSFAFEKFLRWKHEHGLQPSHIKPVGRIILISDGLHNLVDGLLIGASYLSSRPIGVATAIAVILHEFPHEIGDFGVLVDSGYSRGRALLFNFFSACAALIGVCVAFAFQTGVHGFVHSMLAVTAGSFLYIAGSNLTPEMHKENAPMKSLMQFSAMLLGAGLMLLVLMME